MAVVFSSLATAANIPTSAVSLATCSTISACNAGEAVSLLTTIASDWLIKLADWPTITATSFATGIVMVFCWPASVPSAADIAIRGCTLRLRFIVRIN